MKELKMFIDGRFIENESGKWIKVLNPSTEEVISLMPDGTVEDARKAIDAAEKAQNQWERTPSIERAAYLTKIAAGIRKREKELTDIIVREGGKTQDSPMLKFFLPRIIWITWQAGPVGTKGKSFPVTALMKTFSYLRDRLE